ncbi:hypothetical protein PILCRDRAFT_93674, partial [Piloderma croceum F 1598]
QQQQQPPHRHYHHPPLFYPNPLSNDNDEQQQQQPPRRRYQHPSLSYPNPLSNDDDEQQQQPPHRYHHPPLSPTLIHHQNNNNVTATLPLLPPPPTPLSYLIRHQTTMTATNCSSKTAKASKQGKGLKKSSIQCVQEDMAADQAGPPTKQSRTVRALDKSGISVAPPERTRGQPEVKSAGPSGPVHVFTRLRVNLMMRMII